MSRPRQTSDQQILDAALAACMERGAAVSTAYIAEKLGVSQAVLFQRFGTKEKLLRAALRPREPRWLGLAAAGPDDRPFHEQLLELAQDVAAFFDELVPRMALSRSFGLDHCLIEGEDEPPPLRSHRAIADWMQRAIDSGRARACDPDHLAFIFLGSLHVRPWFMHVLGQPRRPVERPAYVANVVDLISSALCPGDGKRQEEQR